MPKRIAPVLAALVALALAAPVRGQTDPGRQGTAPSPPKVELSGGAATFLTFERLRETSTHSETAYSKEVTQLKNLTYHIYWLDLRSRLNEALDFNARISNTNATKLWRWTMEGEPQDDLAWMSFQYAYLGVKVRSAHLDFGYLSVDRANEPLEAHFTPDRTAWTPLAVATMGSLRGVSLAVPLLGRLPDRNALPGLPSKAPSLGLSFTTAVNSDGTGMTTIKETDVDPQETKKYNWPSLDFILRIPYSAGGLSFEPLLAVRTHADEDLKSSPGDGKGDCRLSGGLTGNYAFSSKVSLRCGLGFSRFRNPDTRDEFLGTRVVGDQTVDVYSAVKDNATVYLTCRPQWRLGPGALIGEVKYSTYRNAAPDLAFTTHYANASVMYFLRFHERLMFMPTLRLYTQSYDNPNEQEEVDYSKTRICPQALIAVTF